MSGLLIGDAGADHILTALSSTLKPLQFIEEFQQAYGLNTGDDMSLFLILNIFPFHYWIFLKILLIYFF